MTIDVKFIPGGKADLKEVNPLNILIMSDGFTEEEEDLFLEFIGVEGDKKDSLISKFFEIAPFKYCRGSINLLYAFIPSNRSGIREESSPPVSEEEKTAFGLHTSPNARRLNIWDRSDLVNIVHQLNLPNDFIYPFNIRQSPEQIWFNYPVSKSFGAIGIVANTKSPAILVMTKFLPLEKIEDFLTLDPTTPLECGFFTFTMLGYKPEAGKPYGGFENQFVHELGHILGLGDEYESGPTLDTIKEPIQNNVTYIEEPENLNSEIFRNLKWSDFIFFSQMQDLENKSRVFLYDRIRSDPNIPEYYHDEPNQFQYRFIPGTNYPIHWTQLCLIEGASYCIRKLFRTNFECRMRHHQFKDPIINKKGEKVRIAPEFCKVCNYNIREAITGVRLFRIGNFFKNELRDVYYDLMVRLKDSFDHNINFSNGADSKYAMSGPNCEKASVRMKIMFDQFERTKINIILTPGHCFLKANSSIIIDPVFYDFYQKTPPSLVPSYIDLDGNEKPFDEEIANLGFIGHKKDIISYMWIFKPLQGSKVRPSGWDWIKHVAYEWVEGKYDDKTSLIYDESLTSTDSPYINPIRNFYNFFKEFLIYIKDGNLQGRSNEFWSKAKIAYEPLIIDKKIVFRNFGL